MIVVLVQKVQECCCPKYQVLGCASSHSPLIKWYISDKQKCVNYFDRLVNKLYNLNQILSKHASEAKKKNIFNQFLLPRTNTKMHFETALDSFFVDLMHGNVSYMKWWTIFKIVFTLSHGHDPVERVFPNFQLKTYNKLLSSVKGSFVITSLIFKSPSLKFC